MTAQSGGRLSVWGALVAAATERGELPCPYGTDQCTTVDGHFYHGDCERAERREIAREIREDRTRDASGID